MEKFYLAAFQSGSDAAAALRALRERNVTSAVMPTPRGVTRSCGLSLRFQAQDAETVYTVLDRLALSPEACRFYCASEEDGRRVFRPVQTGAGVHIA